MKKTSPRSTQTRPEKGRDLFDERRWSTAFKIGLLIILTILLIAPFANKAFHIDDPLFLWVAKHIQSQPADPYRFNVTWEWDETEVSQITKNPPLTSYFIALAAYFVGWGEKGLHLVFLVPAIFTVLGTYLLARRFCASPMLSTLVGLVTPVFILSSTTLMSDGLMLTFWVWAILLWVRATERNEPLLFGLSAFLIAVCALTKYYGVSLLFLLPVYSIAKKQKIGSWAIYLIIPIAILVWYQWETHTLYGRGLLLDAGTYASQFRSQVDSGLIAKGFIGLTFAGGCLASLFFFMPFLWSRRVLLIELVVLGAMILTLSSVQVLGTFQLHDEYGRRWPQIIQIGLMAMGGINLIGLAVMDAWNHRKDEGTASSLLLFCWIVGTFIFASFANWSVNGRSILPMAPAFGILLARRMEQRTLSLKKRFALFLPLVPAVVIALFVTWADYGLANSARSAVDRIYETHDRPKSGLWFQGHWGFQYYMELRGGKIAQMHRSPLLPGDLLVIPENNCFTFPLPPDRSVSLRDTIEIIPPCRWLTTMGRFEGGGFYSDRWGDLPFVIGSTLPERYSLLQLESISPAIRPPGLTDHDREKYDQAVASYTQALTANIYDPMTFYNRGNTFAKAGEWDRAISDYTQSLSISPYVAGIYVSRGNIYFLKGEYERSISDYSQALRLDSKDAKTYLRRGGAYLRTGEEGKASEDFGKAKRLGQALNTELLEELRKSSLRRK